MFAQLRCLATGGVIGAVISNGVKIYLEENPLAEFSLGGAGSAGKAPARPSVVPVIKMSGTIESPRSGALGLQSISLQKYEQVLEAAFRAKPTGLAPWAG